MANEFEANGWESDFSDKSYVASFNNKPSISGAQGHHVISKELVNADFEDPELRLLVRELSKTASRMRKNKKRFE